MKKCPYCGKENDDAGVVCAECGTEMHLTEQPPLSSTSKRSLFKVIGIITLVVIIGIAVSAPMLLLAIPVFAIFYAPIHLPFLISFLIRAPEWRGMRWSLRIGSVVALFASLGGMSKRPEFGNDIAGDIAGASHNFAWTWGPGLACAFGAVLLGLVLRVFAPKCVK